MLPTAVLLVATSRTIAGAVTGIHEWSYRLAGFSDAIRVGAAAVLGSIFFAVASLSTVGFLMPRAVLALELLLSGALLMMVRFVPRAALGWRAAWNGMQARTPRALIAGPAEASELLSRTIARAPDAPYRVVGFVGADAEMVGCRIDGHRVLGTLRDLPELFRHRSIGAVLLSDALQPAERMRELVDLCAKSRVRLKIVPSSFARIGPGSPGAILADLSPDDLLPRDAVAFSEGDVRALVSGRRVLVTGAGGSIGGELCSQLARAGVRRLVMVDMNENELYLRARALSDAHPGTDVEAVVADVREAGPLLRLGARYRPQDVFHAAAHKHVPLMECAADEAVKNNVFGSLNVARMAVDCGAERFVLISTDKAVNPSSVMGASKRVAELVVRDLGRSCTSTRVTAVRFGNVLGSAGSVVPLFKQQIANGGPVTVTHPECTRYFMTIREAVGLVLVAGLGNYGELCVLDMGEPIRIVDLARNMIALSGRVPGEDVALTYTGLRPGEKLHEQVLTEEEERVLVARGRIHVTSSPPPPADLEARLAELRRLADAGDSAGVVVALRRLVPTYRSPDPSAASTQDGSELRAPPREGAGEPAAPNNLGGRHGYRAGEPAGRRNGVAERIP
ncbi:nucleoside-diphosphate sugar epimerase/dehydratase [Anaeromyxobacter oryzae]|uniref:nucleoside-diphosphate sugar epimerase/dehydratase n=1 Tax=Anaeromyxobacter oryzae TaxID=2918170 RepID=UPI0020BDDBEA|nr:nucleoside-diphosphate sugar epimerase/dehydratase [Anaeromyxobacter oryzae]